MSEGPDKESKTEEATEKKIRDAVEKGNVPFSREAATLASLLGMVVIASFFLASSVGQLNLSLARLIDNAGGWPLATGAMPCACWRPSAWMRCGFCCRWWPF